MVWLGKVKFAKEFRPKFDYCVFGQIIWDFKIHSKTSLFMLVSGILLLWSIEVQHFGASMSHFERTIFLQPAKINLQNNKCYEWLESNTNEHTSYLNLNHLLNNNHDAFTTHSLTTRSSMTERYGTQVRYASIFAKKCGTPVRYSFFVMVRVRYVGTVCFKNWTEVRYAGTVRFKVWGT